MKKSNWNYGKCPRCRLYRPLTKLGKCPSCLSPSPNRCNEKQKRLQKRQAKREKAEDLRRWIKEGERLKYTIPQKPTKTPPGSHDKILELQRRVENNEYLWHPDDNVLDHFKEF